MFLQKQDLYTHLYPEIVDEIIRRHTIELPSLEDFPEKGYTGYIYITGELLYRWTGTQYEPTTDPDSIVTRVIASAIAEARSYLNRFDLPAMFGTAEAEPTYESEHLKNLVKDIACWHLVRLSNPNINLELFRTAYEDAIKFLKEVQQGKADPGWPYKPDNPDTPGDESAAVQWSSNRKRRQHL